MLILIMLMIMLKLYLSFDVQVFLCIMILFIKYYSKEVVRIFNPSSMGTANCAIECKRKIYPCTYYILNIFLYSFILLFL